MNQRLRDLGIVLPSAPMPVGNYAAGHRVDKLLFISGQLPVRQAQLLYRGRLGVELSVAQGQQAARLCALNLLSQIECHAGTNQVRSIVKLEGFINTSANFTDHAAVLDGASDLIAEVFPEQPLPVRTAIGCSSLPLGAAVELSAIVSLN